MLRTFLGLPALALCVTLAGADATKPGKPSVEAVSLAVQRKLDEKKFGYAFASTSLSIQVVYPGKQFLGVEPTSAVSEFKDDKGASLLSTGFFKTNFSTSPRISNDRTAMVVFINSNVPPTQGANKITLKGNLVIRCGLEEKATEEKEVELKDKAEAKIGDYTLKVFQEKGFGGLGASFNIVAENPIVKGVTAKDADGKPVEVTQTGSYGFGKSWTYTFQLRKPVAKAKIAVTYFTKDEKVTVPVDISFGVGL